MACGATVEKSGGLDLWHVAGVSLWRSHATWKRFALCESNNLE